MPRSVATTIENNFRGGLITEASGLNFPENSCTETTNCVFNYNGTVERRKGLDFEHGYNLKTIDRSASVVNTYLWKNVSGIGDISILVVQVGATLYFYNASVLVISTGASLSTVDLNTFAVAGGASPKTTECQFSSGNGLLFVTHPGCNSFYVSYDTVLEAATATQIDLTIRDTLGDTADPYAVDARPTTNVVSLDVHHLYNLYNQGWSLTNLNTWDAARTDLPSNVDIMWSFKNASDVFATSTIDNVMHGNSSAPKGHFILSVYNQDRDTASGLSGTTNTTTGHSRVSTCAFYAGRLFYSGLAATGFTSKVFFSQIIERPEQYGHCYQQNDPTAEDVFDLLPSDGGVININDSGTIFKLFAIPSGLIVFAANGIWMISGSTGLGFTASDYTVTKIASVGAISSTSFVDVGGLPAWWNADGIYTMTLSQVGGPQIQSMTYTTIRSMYASIPLLCKATAKGFFDSTTGVVQWLYRSTESSDPTVQYEFDSVLNFNAATSAFYQWTLPNSAVKVHGLFVVPPDTSTAVETTVIDQFGQTVVDSLGNTVTAFTNIIGSRVPIFKYLVSYLNAGSYYFTFADESDATYVDWLTYDGVGVAYDSSFTTGYKIHGNAIDKFQPTFISIYSKTDEPVEYYFQSIWNYANAGNTGRWSSLQYVSHSDLNYDYSIRRLKVRGNGLVLQFRIKSLPGKAFKIAGWATQETGNAQP
jgi:hypothetical protein